MCDIMRKSGRSSILLKYADFFLGVPLIFLLSCFLRSTGKKPDIIRRIGVLQTAAIGDTVLMGRVLEHIKNPVIIDVFSGASNYEACCLIANTRRVIRLSATNPVHSIRTIRHQGEYDVWIDFGPWARINALYSFSAKTRYRIGFNTPGQFRHYLYDQGIHHSRNIHEIRNQMNLVNTIFSLNTTKIILPFFSPPIPKLKRTVVFHPYPGGTRREQKRIKVDIWHKLASHFLEKGCCVIVTGDHHDRTEAKRMFSSFADNPRFKIVAGHTNLAETETILKKVCMLITVDTGILHLASKLGCPIVALYGCTSPDRWGPLNSNAIAITSPKSCSVPCVNLGFEWTRGRKCMSHISVDVILAAVQTLLMDQIHV